MILLNVITYVLQCWAETQLAINQGEGRQPDTGDWREEGNEKMVQEEGKKDFKIKQEMQHMPVSRKNTIQENQSIPPEKT